MSDEKRREQTPEAILEFVLERVALSLGTPIEKLDPREPFASFGLDSLAAVELVVIAVFAWLVFYCVARARGVP